MSDLVFHHVLKVTVVTDRDLGLVTVMTHVTPAAETNGIRNRVSKRANEQVDYKAKRKGGKKGGLTGGRLRRKEGGPIVGR